MMIHVCSLRAAQEQINLSGARRVISILSPDVPHTRFDGVADDDHLKMSFHDIAAASDGLEPPGLGHVETLLKFVRGWDQSTPMLIHCWAGVSRSTAAAYITHCALRPRADERELAKALRAASPMATPNAMMVAFADDLLGRDGRMRQAIAAIGRGQEAFVGTPFRWALA